MDDNERIPTNLRTLLILEILGNAGTAMTPAEINEALGLPKQTVYRLCNTLCDEGFLIREDGGKRLRPSRRLRIMASGVLYTSTEHIARHQVLVDVARQVGETVNFVVPEEEGMIYRDRVETDWPFRIQLPVGTHVPFHCTASGKTFMASLKPAQRRTMVESLNLEKLTPNTFSDSEKLLEELEQVAKLGYAVDNEEFMTDMVAIAVPVSDPNGRFAAALAFHGPKLRLTIDDAKERVDIMLNGAERLTKAIFD